MKRIKTFFGGIVLLAAAMVLLVLGISGWNMTRGTALLYADPSFGGIWLSWPWLLLAGGIFAAAGLALAGIGWKSRKPKQTVSAPAGKPKRGRKKDEKKGAEPEERLCPVCGSPIGENDRFCEKCGAKLS